MREVEEAEKGSGGLLIERIHSTPFFKSRPKPLHPIAIVVDSERSGDGRFMALRRDGRHGTKGPDVLVKRMTGVAAVSHYPGWSLWQTVRQGAGHRQFVRPAWCHTEGGGTAATWRRPGSAR